MADKLETGMEALERELNGGVSARSLVVIEAQPGGPGCLFLHELTAVRGTLWLSFARTVEALERSLEETPSHSGSCTVNFELETVFTDDEIDSVLRVPTYGRSHCPAGGIELDITSGVAIDISRDIA